jgi:hypothetical protein
MRVSEHSVKDLDSVTIFTTQISSFTAACTTAYLISSRLCLHPMTDSSASAKSVTNL